MSVETPITDARVKLIGEDGNAFAILARVRRAMRSAGVTRVVCEQFMAEATSDGYDHLLATVLKYCIVDNPDEGAQ